MLTMTYPQLFIAFLDATDALWQDDDKKISYYITLFLRNFQITSAKKVWPKKSMTQKYSSSQKYHPTGHTFHLPQSPSPHILPKWSMKSIKRPKNIYKKISFSKIRHDSVRYPQLFIAFLDERDALWQDNDKKISYYITLFLRK